ncbi:unnamed protein product [Spirodela intermedia]|uniref:Uncharacterized protein n=2 Tax=Spirodela intermedia TaxID=51605 RepID=A0A7I8ISH9_SPIIN|nr:unnamed protein product [Spirodela intermedia]CAA6660479.1 unnamed protein product [Spirodela intermedia]CAA7396828.1 unnamed protein product [Spirodela intermedia]
MDKEDKLHYFMKGLQT